MKMIEVKKKLLLIVLDGWGVNKNKKNNAIKLGKTDFIDSLWENNSHCFLKASGEAVGLPKGFMGNSEVGHQHIGAGRVIKQRMLRISNEIKSGVFYQNKILRSAMLRSNTVHLLGMISDGGVHSHIDHLFGLLVLAKKLKIKKLVVHAILDGRDMHPKSSLKLITKLEKKLSELNSNWKIATISGRYYAMDRDKRWNRTKKGYDMISLAKGLHSTNSKDAIKRAYKRGESDEFVLPTIIGEYFGLKKNDSIIFFNFRSDRAKQITHALTDKTFPYFKVAHPKIKFTCFCKYENTIKAKVAFPPFNLKNTLGELISKKNLKQFRIAETEKWAHVTFFFNGLTDKIFKGEDRLLIPSPKVATYDLTPKMSAVKITNKLISKLKEKKYSFVLVNYANGDMVGHTGKLKATIKAVNTIDECLSKLVPIARENRYDIIITADHGNCEFMSGNRKTSHTINKVPFIYISDKKYSLKNGNLSNIAPTILKIMGFSKPKEMDSETLFKYT